MKNPLTYIQETITELKQVRWPSRQTTINLTVIVILVSLVMAVYVGSLDIGLTKLVSTVLK